MRRRLWWLACMLVCGIALAMPVTADEPSAEIQPGELGRWVDPFIGTGGAPWLCSHNFPGATVPFGLVRLSPDTVTTAGKKALNTSGYFHKDQHLLGFSHTRLVGTGAVDGGHFLVTPLGGPAPKAGRDQALPFSHDNERAMPGYYRVQLEKPDVLVELTATEHAGVHRYTFGPEAAPGLRLTVTSALGGGRASEGTFSISADRRELTGSVRTFGSFSGRFGGLPTYFVARFDQPIATWDVIEGETRTSGQTSASDAERLAVELQFDPQTSRTVLLQLGLSHTSLDNARQNLDEEVGQRSFEEVFASARDAWEAMLGRIRLTGGTDDERTIFLTALYHSLQMPSRFSDVNGQYVGFDKQVHQAEGFTYYSDFSLWDTFRTVHPLYNLIARAEQRDMLVSMVKMSEQGGYLPRWPSGIGYTNSMLSTPADMMITESYLKGIRDFDVETAYQAMLRTARQSTPPGAGFSGREGVEQYRELGYCPDDKMHESVARTLEFAHGDHSISRLAAALGYEADAEEFRQMSQNYRNLWNPDTGFFHPRNADGTFSTAFRPRLMSYVDFDRRYTKGYVEGSAWQWRWSVPFDPQGMIELFGGPEKFVTELESFMAGAPQKVGATPSPDYWHGNQPDIHAAYLFNEAGRPDLTQKWVRWILANKYDTTEVGLDGNDDGGTLSAWYVTAALGLYPVPGTDIYQLASPVFERAELQVGEQTLVIEAEGASPENIYVAEVTLNGQPLEDRRWLKHEEIAPGGKLHFRMTNQPVMPAK